MRKRTLLLTCWLCFLTVVIASLFWYNEWKYNLPTPVPAHYKAIVKGSVISLPPGFNAGLAKPVFLHFFNPDCPCSRFNMPHVRSLVQQYGHEVNFAVVLMTSKPFTARQLQEKYGLDVPIISDSSLAAACGVYATPQAVLLDGKHQLIYRGNYNRTRYCNDPKTNYAQMALQALLEQKSLPGFDHFALKAYGCSLPVCTQ
jgi:hypothetical protein